MYGAMPAGFAKHEQLSALKISLTKLATSYLTASHTAHWRCTGLFIFIHERSVVGDNTTAF